MAKKIRMEGLSDKSALSVTAEQAGMDVAGEVSGQSTFYQKVFEAIPIPVFVKDRSHRWIMFNNSLCDLQGSDRHHLLNKNDYDFFPPDQSLRLWEIEEQLFKDHLPVFIEEFTIRNGHESYVLIKKTVITDEKGEEYIVGGCVDITERKRAEMIVKESEERFRSLVKHSPDIITILNKDATVRYATPSFFHLLGFSAEEVIGMSIYSFIGVEHVFAVQQKIEEIGRVSEMMASISFHAVTKSEELLILDAKITNLTTDPSVKGMVINAKDITRISLQAGEIQRMNQILQKDNIVLKEELNQEVRARVNLKIVDFNEFHKVYPNDEACYFYLADKKWKKGYSCQRCRNPKHSKGKSPFSRRCTICGFDESPLSGTIFANQKFSVTKGFYMAFLISSQNKITSLQLSSMLTLRKDTCAAFKRKFLKTYRLKHRLSKLTYGWEDLLFEINGNHLANQTIKKHK